MVFFLLLMVTNHTNCKGSHEEWLLHDWNKAAHVSNFDLMIDSVKSIPLYGANMPNHGDI